MLLQCWLIVCDAGPTSKQHWVNASCLFCIGMLSLRTGSYTNEMNRTLGHFCAHVGLIGLGEPPEDGDMSEMTLPSRHRIRNSNPGDMRPSMLRTSKEVIYITALVAYLSVTEAPTILLRMSLVETFLLDCELRLDSK